MPDIPLYFVVGCARSGTTSLCRILDSAENGICVLEPNPNLNYETREFMEGRFQEPYGLLAETVIPRAAQVLDTGLVYGEKNVTLGPFIPYLDRMTRCKFVYVKRDGRDVVRSLINWHNQMFGSIYRECKEEGGLTARAQDAVSKLPVEQDMSDYSRPRPGPDDIWCEKWANFTRLEMCAWYWSRINELFLDRLEALPGRNWIAVDYTWPKAQDVMRVARFLGLEGLSVQSAQAILDSRLNSLEDRIGESGLFPRWRDWTALDRVRFECIAARTMQRLGYYPEQDFVRYRPPDYGDWWRRHEGGVDWYTWMYNGRRSAHIDFMDFIADVDRTEGPVRSLLDVGCGLAVGYAEAFAERRYAGFDLSEKEIVWCRENRPNPQHTYICGDIITDPPSETFDVVFSQGTIDNSYDMDAYLKAMVSRSRGWIYVTAYRGWFSDLPEHRYGWDEDTTCFYNDISPAGARKTLESLGCTDISIESLAMVDAAVTQETRIVARAPRKG